QDFWRRWHMTLSYWIRDYLYLPLGGNRANTRNILIIFTVGGLWHGAGWTFIVWGLFHGVLVVLYHFTRPAWDRIPGLIQQAVTFILVSFGWVLFIFDFKGIMDFGLSLFGRNTVTVADPNLELWAGVAVAAVVCFVPKFEAMAENRRQEFWTSMVRSAGFAGLFMTMLFFLDRSHTFIYFRF
ncbi:MAG: hypothetical protein O3A85_09125, partial [Proteobacteria bacterium]|nr:hypothetical protein [Pseudomonadota bacterium]